MLTRLPESSGDHRGPRLLTGAACWGTLRSASPKDPEVQTYMDVLRPTKNMTHRHPPGLWYTQGPSGPPAEEAADVDLVEPQAAALLAGGAPTRARRATHVRLL